MEPLRRRGNLGALHEEIGEDAFVILVGGDAAIIRFDLTAATLDATEEGVQFSKILVANERWFGHETAARLEINEANRAIEFKLHLGLIQ